MGRTNRLLTVIVCLPLVLAALFGFWLLLRPDNESDQAALEGRSLISQKNKGIGYLENGRYAESSRVFENLKERLPGELLPRRNLTVSRLLALTTIKQAEEPEKYNAAVRDATETIAHLKDAEDGPVPHVLAAKLAERHGESQKAIDELQAASEAAPENPSVWFQLYEALQASRRQDAGSQAANALRKTYQLRPRNLAVLIEWLNVQARAEDQRIVESLENARDLLRPFAVGVQTRSGFDVLGAIEESFQAAEDGRWPVVQRNTAFLGNVMKPEVAVQIDRRRISPHEMEHLLTDFSAEFYQEHDISEPDVPDAIPVTLERASNDRQFPDISGARAIELTDFNLDGRLDLIVLTSSTAAVFGRAEDSDRWRKMTETGSPRGAAGIVVADLDRDHVKSVAHGDGKSESDDRQAAALGCMTADVDLVVFGEAGARVFRNVVDKEKQRRLEPVEQPSEFRAMSGILAAAAADLDHDGDLDLILSAEEGVSLWINRDNFTFAEISDRSSLPPKGLRATTIVPVDFNRDAAIDLLLAGPGGAGWLENHLHGSFRWRDFGEDFDAAQATGLAAAELDGNASWDLVTVSEEGIAATLTANRTPGVVRPLKKTSVGKGGSKSLVTWDFDNDGFRDLLLHGQGTVTTYRGRSGGRFQETSLFASAPQQVLDCAVGDIDGDGDEDLAMADAEGVSWYENEGGNANGWIDVSLRAEALAESRPAERVNMHGIGSLLELKAGAYYQAQTVAGPTTHFGLGKRKRADVLRVLWTNGIPQNVLQPQRKQPVCMVQELKTSCPYLYTWTGSRFEFLTDCLWAAPLGLQMAEGVLAPDRPWEYLRIPGERLVPEEGEYRLQITEELWEAVYFDAVRLIAVDHPSGVEIYSNEKVGPAEIAEFEIHTARNPQLPSAARDKHGRDILPLLAERDGRYVKAFDGRIKQGLVDEHYLELDLGQLDDPRRVTLFLTGWLFPTDTSLNIGISQNPELQPPRPPSIQVLDERGRWVEAVSYMGFPGGKTKTIAVDVSGIFPTDDYRLRIVTSMELYWDAAFFTVDEGPAPLSTRDLKLVGADLHYRGFSKRVPGKHHGPERYLYQQVTTEPQWPPMGGRFTRYGDVTELLKNEDDRLVVMGAGDEMTLRFRVPDEPPPDGWERDFLIYNVGWDKDADLNTVYGQTSEPLPFRNMTRYPLPAGETAPQDRRYRQYLQTYQTRRQNHRAFWGLLRGPGR